MPKKNRKSVEPVSLPVAPAHFHPRDWEDYVHEVNEWRVYEKTNRYLRQVLGPVRFPTKEHFDFVREGYIKKEAIHIANNESEKAFWDDLKKGKLVLVGYRDTGDGRLWRIPKYVWTDPRAFEDWHKGRLSGCGLDFVNVAVFKSADAKKVPDYCEAKEEQPERPEPPKVPKGMPGRKTTWDWNGASREMVTLAHTVHGLPHPQAAVENHIMQWFLDHYDGQPAESQIRKFVVDHLPENYRNSE